MRVARRAWQRARAGGPDSGVLRRSGDGVALRRQRPHRWTGVRSPRASETLHRSLQAGFATARGAGRAGGRTSGVTHLAKRALDIVLSGIGLAISMPLWALIALAIKIDDGGHVFYSQPRVGAGGREFRAYKVRSRVADAEAHVGARQATDGDPRITRVGRWLRATAMDELPQLWSIFRGDMSFVGPRALRPGEIEVSGGGRLVALEDVPGFEERC